MKQASELKSDSSVLSEQLSCSSSPYDDPLKLINWSALDNKTFWLPEEAISLFGTEEYARMSATQKQLLSQAEFLNFVEAGLWLESLFMERIGRSVRGDRARLPDLTYHLHELREEAGHSLMFLELINRRNLQVPHSHFRQLSFANFFARYAPFDSAMFWIAVLVGEQVPDKMNRVIRKHREYVCATIVDIVSIHIQDEARHIAHAKSMINDRLAQTGEISRKIMNLLISKMFSDFVSAYYYPPNAVYYTAGLDSSINWKKLALDNHHRKMFVENSVSTTIETINSQGFQLSFRPG